MRGEKACAICDGEGVILSCAEDGEDVRCGNCGGTGIERRPQEDEPEQGGEDRG